MYRKLIMKTMVGVCICIFIFLFIVIGFQTYIRYGDPLSTTIVENRVTMFLNNLRYGLKLEREIDKIVNEIIRADMNDHEKIIAINDYIIQNVEYELDKNVAFVSLQEGTGNCASFSYLAYRMYKKVGIESKIVFGMLNVPEGSKYHAWNMVKVDDLWFHSDLATISDVFYKGENYIKAYISFFGCSDEQLSSLAKWKSGVWPKAEKSYIGYLADKARKNDKEAIGVLKLLGVKLGL